MKTLLKILAWTVMSLLLIAVGSLIVTVKLLTPDRLTPLVNYGANRALNADVSVQRAELTLRKSYPFMNLRLDSLTVVSRDMLQLPAQLRDSLPSWADTLLQAKSISGGINIAMLSTGEFFLNDIAIDGLQANAVIVNDSVNNFTIVAPSAEEDSDTAAVTVPNIRVKSFALTDLTRLRYLDVATDTRVAATLSQCRLDNDADAPPRYVLDFATNIDTPLLQIIRRNQLGISIDGTLDWNHETPMRIQMSDFNVAVDQIAATFSLDADFADEPRLDALDLDIKPVSLSYLLSLVPEDMVPAAMQTRRRAPLQEGQNYFGIATDAAIALTAKLNQPYLLDSGDIPYAEVGLSIADSYLKWQRVDLRTLIVDAGISLRGNDLNAATAHIENLVIAGPATTIKLTGDASRLIDDPKFVGSINGHVIVDRLPPVLTSFLDGGMASGVVDLNAKVNAAMSMFTPENFHRIRIEGTAEAKDLYYLSADTQMMVYAQHAQAKFGTNTSYTVARHRRRADTTVMVKLDSLLTATLTIDSAQILASGMMMKATDFKLGVGASNKQKSADTTEITPMGGKLTVGSFSLLSLGDSAGLRLRNFTGQISMRRYRGDSHMPLFTLNADIGRLSAGSNGTRFMLRDANLSARINKLPETPGSLRRKAFRHTADSIQRLYPMLPPDSVYAMALEIRRRNSTHQRRVREEADSSHNEIIDWGTSPAVRSLLLDWRLRGSINARTARLFTTAFPVRNRVDSLMIRFNNDSVMLDNVRYKAGHSDFTLNGMISNIKRAFTSRSHSPLQISLGMLSDTIDVNELAKAFFTGAANREAALHADLDDEKSLERAIEQTAETDSTGPLLIPVNIDAEFDLQANNVLYANFLLKDLTGKVLAYDGALSLYQLKAASDVGAINLSALYSAPQVEDMEFGMGLKLNDFRIGHFLQLVPAIDSIMPMLRDFDGIINANIAATSEVDPEMNLVLPSMNAAINLEGDSLVVIDEATFKTMAKWLMFKNKNKNFIEHMSVEMVINHNMMQIYPFMFDFDRYRIGVQGHNDLDMNFDYHVAVLKSPIPFKFGVNIKGNPDDYKIRLGKARFNANNVIEEVAIADTTRLNLIQQFENVFRRGVRESGMPQVNVGKLPGAGNIDLATDTLSAADSLYLKQEGLIPENLK